MRRYLASYGHRESAQSNNKQEALVCPTSSARMILVTVMGKAVPPLTVPSEEPIMQETPCKRLSGYTNVEAPLLCLFPYLDPAYAADKPGTGHIAVGHPHAGGQANLQEGVVLVQRERQQSITICAGASQSVLILLTSSMIFSILSLTSIFLFFLTCLSTPLCPPPALHLASVSRWALLASSKASEGAGKACLAWGSSGKGLLSRANRGEEEEVDRRHLVDWSTRTRRDRPLAEADTNIAPQDKDFL